MNNQLPREIQWRSKALFRLRRQVMEKGKKDVISVDKMYMDRHLYNNRHNKLLQHITTRVSHKHCSLSEASSNQCCV